MARTTHRPHVDRAARLKRKAFKKANRNKQSKKSYKQQAHHVEKPGFTFTFHKFPAEVRNTILEYYFLNKHERQPPALLKALRPDTVTLKAKGGNAYLYEEAMLVYSKTYEFRFYVLNNSSISNEERLNNIRHMKLTVPHIRDVGLISNQFKLATNLRHLTLISTFKKGFNSLAITVGHILPEFFKLKTVTVEHTWPGITPNAITRRRLKIARRECSAFLPMMETLLDATAQWYFEEKMDIWEWVASAGEFLGWQRVEKQEIQRKRVEMEMFERARSLRRRGFCSKFSTELGDWEALL